MEVKAEIIHSKNVRLVYFHALWRDNKQRGSNYRLCDKVLHFNNIFFALFGLFRIYSYFWLCIVLIWFILIPITITLITQWFIIIAIILWIIILITTLHWWRRIRLLIIIWMLFNFLALFLFAITWTLRTWWRRRYIFSRLIPFSFTLISIFRWSH